TPELAHGGRRLAAIHRPGRLPQHAGGTRRHGVLLGRGELVTGPGSPTHRAPGAAGHRHGDARDGLAVPAALNLRGTSLSRRVPDRAERAAAAAPGGPAARLRPWPARLPPSPARASRPRRRCRPAAWAGAAG